jgi:uncharacterized membrane protein
MNQPNDPMQRPPGSAPAGGFDMNQPTIIVLLYLASFVFGLTSIVGVVLAFNWKGEARGRWDESHYTYLINTFWIMLIGGIVGFVLLIVLIGFLILIATAVLVVVRCVMSLQNAQKQMPMPDPNTWKW